MEEVNIGITLQETEGNVTLREFEYLIREVDRRSSVISKGQIRYVLFCYYSVVTSYCKRPIILYH